MEERDRQAIAPGQAVRVERLPMLYQGILTVIVRIQAGRQKIPDQRTVESLLDEIEREGIRAGYSNQDIQDAHYAVIAFLDEVIHRSNAAGAERWASLQAKRYGKADAGDVVYDRLKEIRTRRDSVELADVLEVYCLCFLLGYGGRYYASGPAGQSELNRLGEDLRAQIERIRGRPSVLSPEGYLPSAPAPQAAPAAPASLDGRWKVVALCAVGIAVVGWIAMYSVLNSYTGTAIQALAGFPAR